jgi:sigma-E factor negative regulatory protein RseA
MNHEQPTDDLRRQLSALMDGELERDQARFLLRRVPGDAELSGCWQRWHVAGECLRGHGAAPLRQDFAARIAAAVDAESVPARGYGATVLKWAGGFAVAASVAMAALIAVAPSTTADPAAARGLVTGPSAVPGEVAPSPYREQDLRPPMRLDAQLVAATDGAPFAAAVRLDPRIERYLVRHNEATAGQGFVPYATLVTPLRERVPASEPAR